MLARRVPLGDPVSIRGSRQAGSACIQHQVVVGVNGGNGGNSANGSGPTPSARLHGDEARLAAHELDDADAALG